MTEQTLTSPAAPTRRVIDLVRDWAHAIAHLVIIPVVVGAILDGRHGAWVGWAAFALFATWGAVVVYRRYVPCPHPDAPWDWGSCRVCDQDDQRDEP